MTSRQSGLLAKLIATFAITQIVLFLGSALYRIVPHAIAPWVEGSMSPFQKGLYLVWAAINAYAEGYRGFQKRYAPRVVGRAVHLGENPEPLHLVLALPFCMSLFHSVRRQRIVSWCLVFGIAGLVAIVKRVPQPWRGIVDGGVVIGLLWGVAAVLVLFVRYLLGSSRPAATDLPASQTAST